MSDALRPITGRWLEVLRLAHDFKKAEYQDDADECARFFDGPYNSWLYQNWGSGSSSFEYGGPGDLPGPDTKITVNKVAELVQLFGPALYHRNPVRKVNPRQVVGPPEELLAALTDPALQANPALLQMMQQQLQQVQQLEQADRRRAEVLQQYLNWTPEALDLKTESRWAIDEALIKGLGCLWTVHHKPPGSAAAFAGTFFDSADNLQLDPDAFTIKAVKWIARKRVRPVWEVSREFGVPEEMLRQAASLESTGAQAESNTDPQGDYRRKTGRSADLVVYWDVYSKMGLGGRLRGIDPAERQAWETWGDYAYLAVADGCSYPLNLPPPFCDAAAAPNDPRYAHLAQEIAARLAWPTPFWADGRWPLTPVAFHWKPNKLWPVSHMKPGLGELCFLNWAWSFLAAKVRLASRDFIAIAKAAGQELKDRIKHAGDYTVIEVEQLLGGIDNVVKFLQHPGFNPEVYRVIQGVTENFERRVGLTELMYGLSSRQIRSAQEAQAKQDAVSVRPDDMANTVEDCMTEAARKEAFVASWHLKGQDVLPVLGPAGAQAWEQLVVPADPRQILYGYEYRIEAGSARKPNKSNEADTAQQAVTQLFAPLFQYAQMTGEVGPINTLITDWAKAVDRDPTGYLLSAPPPPMSPGGPAAEAAPGAVAPGPARNGQARANGAAPPPVGSPVGPEEVPLP
jgi:hypothetical protein